MSRRSDSDRRREDLRRRLIGLGEGSLHKSYYPELQQRLGQLETTNADLQREIAERTRAERSLRASEGRYSMAQKLAGIGTWEWRLDTDEFIWSEEVENIWGGIPQELIGGSEDLLNRIHPKDRERWRESVRACIVNGIEHDIEYRLLFPGGVVVWVAAIGNAERDENGRTLRMMGVVRDITKLKTVEHELLKAAELKQRIVDSLPIGIAVFNTLGDCILANHAHAEMIGGTTSEILAQNLHSIASWKDSGLYDLALHALQSQTVEHLEAELTTTYGKTAIFDFRLVPVAAGDEQHLLLVVDDISERKKAEQELRTSEERFRLLIENAGVFISIYDRDGVCLMMNPMLAESFGGDPEEVIGKNFHDLHPDAADEYIDRIRAVIDSGSPRDYADVVRFPTGERHLVSNVHPMWDSSGEVVAAQIISHDVTARRVLEEQLAQSQKMEAVGRLAGGVAHDFNNMLGVILGNTEMVMATMDRDDPRYDDLVEIEQAAQRSADLTRQLLGFARRQTIIPSVLDLNKTLSGMLTMFRRLLGENIELRWRPAADLWNVRMDPTQVAQLLANFCANARDAILDVGTLEIATSNAVLDEASCAGRSNIRPGEYVRLSISDNGRGMDEETASRIFEPFFTTKDVGEGTGLGLATVHGIVSQNGGFVDVASSPEKGTTFEVYLPRSNNPPAV